MEADCEENEQRNSKGRKYKKISFEERMKAIKLIKEERLSYRKVGKQLGMSSSTIKMIISRYEKTGTVFERKKEKQLRGELTNKISNDSKY